MKEKQAKLKQPISHKLIFKIMFWITLCAAGGFFVKNVIAVNVLGMIAIGVCHGAFFLLYLSYRFSVVASEMKVLSENSENFSKQVTKVIETLSAQVEKMHNSSEENKMEFFV